MTQRDVDLHLHPLGDSSLTELAATLTETVITDPSAIHKHHKGKSAAASTRPEALDTTAAHRHTKKSHGHGRKNNDCRHKLQQRSEHRHASSSAGNINFNNGHGSKKAQSKKANSSGGQITQAHKRSRPNSETESDSEVPKRAKRVPENLETLFRRLRSAREKQVRFQYHAKYLTKYLEEGRVPKGLTPNIKPSIGTLDTTFSARWDGILKECAVRLTEASRDHCQATLIELEPEINALTSQLRASTEGEATIEFVNELVERRTVNLSTKKEKKFSADKTSTRSKKWQTRQKTAKPSKRHGALDILQTIVAGLHKSMQKM